MSDRFAGNPFRTIHADAWADPVDVSSINAPVSDLILERIEAVRRAGAQRSDRLASTCILLLGPAGSGKTHLFARLRKLVRARAVFIHTRPQIGVEPSPRFVLRSIVDSLRQPVLNDEHLQLEVVAGAILAAHDGGNARWPLAVVEDARNLGDGARRELVARVVDAVEERFPEIASDYLERLLAVPFASRQDRRALLTWLSGREPSASDLERVGAPGQLAEADVMRALSTVAVAAAYGAPVVLVFDQLENLAEDGGKTERIHAHARLVSDLRDTVRGLVIVQMALDAEWMTRIHPALHASDRDRLEEQVCRLALPSPEQRRALLERWCEGLPDEARKEPFPRPFRAEDVDAWCARVGMTPRMLMQEAGEAYLTLGGHGGHPPADDSIRPEAIRDRTIPEAPADHASRLAAHWEAALERARREIDDEARQQRGAPAERLAGGLLAALQLGGAEVTTLPPKAGMAMRASLGARDAEVAIAQHVHPKSLAAAIRAAAARSAATRVFVLRERALAIPPTWREVERCVATLVGSPGAAFHLVERDDVARLLALESFITAARSQDLSADDGGAIAPTSALAWVKRDLDCARWAVVASVLGALAPASVLAAEASPPAERTPPPTTPAEPGSSGAAHAALQRLRVASIERIVREAKASDPTITRARAVAELRASGARFFGESIAVLGESR